MMDRQGEHPWVSVIIPVFNDRERLELCLHALDEQTYPRERVEVLVVDNGSDDDVAAVQSDHRNVIVLLETKKGSYAARNKGLASAKGEVLAFTDADCLPRPDWLERGVAHLLGRDDAGFVGGRIDLFPKDPHRPTAAEIYDMVTEFPQESHVIDGGFSVTANMMTWRRVLDQVGPFDDRLQSVGDKELTRRITDAGFEPIYGDDVVVCHPARDSMAELFRKQRRVAKGQYTMATAVKGTGLKRLVQRYTTFLLAESAKIARSTRTPSVGHRWTAVGVNLAVRAVGLLEISRLYLADLTRRLRAGGDLADEER